MRAAKLTRITVPNGLPAAQAAPAAPDRVLLQFSPPNAAQVVYLTTDRSAAVLTGLVLTQQTGPLVLRVEEVGDAVGWAWYATSDTNNTALAVLEVTERRQGRGR